MKTIMRGSGEGKMRQGSREGGKEKFIPPNQEILDPPLVTHQQPPDSEDHLVHIKDCSMLISVRCSLIAMK